MSLRKTVSVILVGLVALALSAGIALADARKVELEVVGLLCGKDTYAVSAILDSVIGIEDYELDITDQTAVITFDDEDTSVADIGAKLDKRGYGVNRVTFISE